MLSGGRRRGVDRADFVSAELIWDGSLWKSIRLVIAKSAALSV
jgi:hypothetical protein